MRKISLPGKAIISLTFCSSLYPSPYSSSFHLQSTKSRTIWSGFTFDWYSKLFSDSTVMSSLYVTLSVSILAAVIATIVGTFAPSVFSI